MGSLRGGSPAVLGLLRAEGRRCSSGLSDAGSLSGARHADTAGNAATRRDLPAAGKPDPNVAPSGGHRDGDAEADSRNRRLGTSAGPNALNFAAKHADRASAPLSFGHRDPNTGPPESVAGRDGDSDSDSSADQHAGSSDRAGRDAGSRPLLHVVAGFRRVTAGSFLDR